MFFIAYLNDPNKTAAVGLGVSVLTMLCEAPVTGMNGGISVIVSIAYGGRRFEDCSRALQLGRVLTLMTFFLTLVPLSRAGDMLKFFGIDDQIVMET